MVLFVYVLHRQLHADDLGFEELEELEEGGGEFERAAYC